MLPEQRNILYLTAAVAAVSLLVAPSHARLTSSGITHRGFVIDTSAVQDCPRLRAALMRQIDIVADSGIDLEILDFFCQQRIVVNPNLGSQPGYFTPGKGIELSVHFPNDMPVLLHELLHAFHYHWLDGGFQNADVLEFYRRAHYWKVHPTSCYAMSNVAEFFAMTSSAYLYGEWRPPYTREDLEQRQPNYCDWLYEVFGV